MGKPAKIVRGSLSLLWLLVLVAILITPVVAAPQNPDSITVHTAKVFQNIFESDDMLFVISYDLEYGYDADDAPEDTPEPDESADETFQLTLYDTDGETELLTRELNYYQYNVHSLYFDADAAEDLTWESDYVLRLMGNPVYFEPEESVTMDTVALSPANWLEGTQSASRALLEAHCLDLASTLEDTWSLELIVTVPEGQVLNSVGRTIFLDAIPELDTVMSDLFQISISTITVTTDDYGGALETSTTVSGKLGTAIAASFSGIADFLNISSEMAAFLWIALFALTVASIVFLNTGNTTAALVLVIPIIIMGAFVGAIPLAVLFVLLAIAVIYMGYHIWLRGM